jgi:hypothetical protein
MLEFVTSQRGQRKLVVDGFLFERQKDGAFSTVIWKCDRHKGCKARITTQDDDIAQSMLVHNHERPEGKILVDEARNEIKRLARTTEEKPRTIISRVLSRLPVDIAAANLPSFDSIGRSIRQIRQRETPQLSVEQSDRTIGGELFKQVCSTGLVLFAAQGDLAFLVQCDRWFADGTFKVSPENFYQVYSIHGLRGDRSFPCVYALLSSKTEHAYSKMLSELKELNRGLSPMSIVVDFELSAMRAFRSAFPSATIEGCRFHFGQCIWRKIQEKCLATSYHSEPEFACQAKQLLALRFIPSTDVQRVFSMLRPTLDAWLNPIV